MIKMNPKSTYINGDLFINWLKTHFLPRKPAGKVLLVLDGHVSHMDRLELIDLTEANDTLLLCLPSHGTK